MVHLELKVHLLLELARAQHVSCVQAKRGCGAGDARLVECDKGLVVERKLVPQVCVVITRGGGDEGGPPARQGRWIRPPGANQVDCVAHACMGLEGPVVLQHHKSSLVVSLTKHLDPKRLLQPTLGNLRHSCTHIGAG